MADGPTFKKIAVIGAGLIGSSFARAARVAGIVGELIGWDRDAAVLAEAMTLGVFDRAAADLDTAIAHADLVMIAVPVGAYRSLGPGLAAKLHTGAIVTDVGSVKEDVIDALAPFMPEGTHFVPGHPVAGTERSGPAAGFAELFQNRWCILTPPDGTDGHAVETVAAMWRALGCDVEIMDAHHHDRVLAITSHLPHLISYTIVATAADLEDQLRNNEGDDDRVTTTEVIKFSAGGFRDFTRIAGSDPVMWRDVFLANKDAVLDMLGRSSEDLTALQRAIRWGDSDTLESLFSRTREIRRGVVEAGQAGRFVPTENGDKEPE
ncbi:MAG: prephenate/arogenate dehydrogenase family protein [Alphaproteobacteria bacterium]|nr:prephenate/arogenate dehydrogenase family protein [Alphaproteobacteria bacterium]